MKISINDEEDDLLVRQQTDSLHTIRAAVLCSTHNASQQCDSECFAGHNALQQRDGECFAAHTSFAAV